MNMRVINFIKRAAAVLLFAPALAIGAGATLHLDKAPVSTEPAALQHGAKLFVNYCLNCHGASYVRYNQLEKIGLSEQMIRDNLLFTGDKVGDLMKISMTRDDGKTWFGAPPPDLSVIARARAITDRSGGGAPNQVLPSSRVIEIFIRSPTLSPVNSRLSRIICSDRPIFSSWL